MSDTYITSWSNVQEGVVLKPIGIAGALDLIVAGFLAVNLMSSINAPVGATDDKVTKPTGGAGGSGVLAGLKAFAGRWWYPWIVGALSGINNFTLVLSGPLVVLFISGVLANPSRRFIAALANAVGTVAGVYGIMQLLELHGEDYLRASLPSVFASQAWDTTEHYVQAYGWGGAVLVSCMPIVLQPLICICVLAGMPSSVLLASVFIGRTIKYSIMAQLAVTAPHLLRFFGKTAEHAAQSERKDK